MNYEFSDRVLDEAFDAVEDYVATNIRDDEFTAKMMHDKYGTYSRRYWRERLKDAEADGVLESRYAKLPNGRRGLAFRVVDGEEYDGEHQ